MDTESEFVEMIKSHEGTIYKVILSYTRDKEEIMDLYQEVVFQLWKSYPGFKNNSKVSTWMYRVVLNTALTHQRNERRRKTKLKEVSLFDFNYTYNHDLDLRISKLYDAIHTLSKIERAIILLHLEGSSHQEISEIMGISSSNAGTRISRIKKKLFSLLKHINDGNE